MSEVVRERDNTERKITERQNRGISEGQGVLLLAQVDLIVALYIDCEPFQVVSPIQKVKMVQQVVDSHRRDKAACAYRVSHSACLYLTLHEFLFLTLHVC